MLSELSVEEQECIPVGFVLSAAMTVSPVTHIPLPCTPPCHTCPLPCMASATHTPTPPHTPPLHHTCFCHACPLLHPLHHHTCPLPCMPPAMHAPCHTCPLPCIPPTTHTPFQARRPPPPNKITDACENSVADGNKFTYGDKS